MKFIQLNLSAETYSILISDYNLDTINSILNKTKLIHNLDYDIETREIEDDLLITVNDTFVNITLNNLLHLNLNVN